MKESQPETLKPAEQPQNFFLREEKRLPEVNCRLPVVIGLQPELLTTV
jgi:hypothetical protein